MITHIGTPKEIGNDYYADYKSGKLEMEQQYKMEITKFKGGRNEKQNALYNATLLQVSKALSQSLMLTRDEIHNKLLGEMGILETVEGNPLAVRIPEEYDYMKDNEQHLKSIRTYEENGKHWRVCYVLKESKNYTEEEFAKLIDRLITFIIDQKLDGKIDVSHLRDLAERKNV